MPLSGWLKHSPWKNMLACQVGSFPQVLEYRKNVETTERSSVNVNNTVDGSEILRQLRLVVYPIVYKVF